MAAMMSMEAHLAVCVSKIKPCLRRFMFAVSSGLINFLGTGIMFAGIYVFKLKIVAKFVSSQLPNAELSCEKYSRQKLAV